MTINVEDVNDNSPFFNQTVYDGVISETQDVGKSVMTVKADDRDSGTIAFIGPMVFSTKDYRFAEDSSACRRIETPITEVLTHNIKIPNRFVSVRKRKVNTFLFLIK